MSWLSLKTRREYGCLNCKRDYEYISCTKNIKDTKIDRSYTSFCGNGYPTEEKLNNELRLSDEMLRKTSW